ncbi:tumor necrosis factor receptor superfamily member 5-like [Heptranchias perlo]|uniref:tumor necrosis factor receptor superfamily member 5-like n=1 Tax=Heptranchias perlo TaxID=212740 RepID=UPI0035597007
MDPVRFILLSCAISLYQCASPSDCNIETQYFKTDKCCFKCGPGSFAVAECETSEYSSCQPCPTGFYQPVWTKEDHCRKHSSCDSGDFEVVKAGDLIKDVECLCKKGRHCANRDCEVCRNDDICPQGSGVKTPGDRKYNGTICEECKVGFYSDVTSSTEPCRKWMDCASLGLVTAKPGSSQTDVACDVPLQDCRPCGAAIGCLVVILVLVIVLFICSRMGYLNQAMDAIRRQMNRRLEQKDEDPEKAAQEAQLVDRVHIGQMENGQNENLHGGIQEVGNDSHPSKEEEQKQPAQPNTPMGRDGCVSGQGANGNAGREWTE